MIIMMIFLLHIFSFQGGRSQTGVLVPSWNAQSQLHLHLGHLVHLRREEVRL